MTIKLGASAQLEAAMDEFWKVEKERTQVAVPVAQKVDAKSLLASIESTLQATARRRPPDNGYRICVCGERSCTEGPMVEVSEDAVQMYGLREAQRRGY